MRAARRELGAGSTADTGPPGHVVSLLIEGEGRRESDAATLLPRSSKEREKNICVLLGVATRIP